MTGTTADKATRPKPKKSAGRSSKLRTVTRCVVWARGAGRCHFCNKQLIGDYVMGLDVRYEEETVGVLRTGKNLGRLTLVGDMMVAKYEGWDDVYRNKGTDTAI